jgi:general stress protein 26
MHPLSPVLESRPAIKSTASNRALSWAFFNPIASMQQQILDYLDSQRIGVFAIRMPDGSPHAATLHFAFNASLLEFIFQTSPDYKKVQPLYEGETSAALVIGTSEDMMKTLQLNGIARLADSEEIKDIYYKKFPEKLDKYPDNIFFVFKPTWWRFTDWTTPQGRVVISSTD